MTYVPATFQQLDWDLPQGSQLEWCIIYLENIVIFLKDPASHLRRLEAIFKNLEHAGLKLKQIKCKLFHQHITYLGHIISAQGIATDR